MRRFWHESLHAFATRDSPPAGDVTTTRQRGAAQSKCAKEPQSPPRRPRLWLVAMSSSAPSAEADAGLYFGLIALFAVAFPLALCRWRLLTRPREGLAAMWSPPYDIDPAKRRLSSRLRSLLFQRTTWGFQFDVLQAVLSGMSCILFITVSFMGEEPLWITDVEDAFTVYFLADYAARLWLAQDSLAWYFSLTSGLDFITTVPALTVWLIQEGNTFDTSVAAIVQVRCAAASPPPPARRCRARCSVSALR